MTTDIMVGQLLENAFKPNGGTITVAARAAGDWIEVTVDDGGIGIAPVTTGGFEQFVRADRRPRRFGGIGLDLHRPAAGPGAGRLVAASSRPAAGPG
jgi:signal transduction histidine kinase